MRIFFLSTLLIFSALTAKPAKILIFYSEAGGGHKATSEALKTELLARDPELVVQTLNARAHMGGRFENFCFGFLEDIYTNNLGSSRGRWMNRFFGDYLITPITRCLEQFSNRQMRVNQEQHNLIHLLQNEKPDLVISTASFINRHLKQAIDYANVQSPFIVTISDFDEAHKVMWTSASPGTHYIVRRGAKLLNPVEEKYLHPMSGVCIRSHFHPEKQTDKEKITALVCFGGHGSREMVDLMSYFQKQNEMRAIFIAGGNEKLKKQLEAVAPKNCEIVGYTRELHRYMQQSDFLIGKPGPGTITEAIHSNLPLYLKGGSDLMKQEEGVLAWVLEEHYGAKWDTIEDFHRNFGGFLSELNAFKIKIEGTEKKNPTIEAVDYILDLLPIAEKEVS